MVNLAIVDDDNEICDVLKAMLESIFPNTFNISVINCFEDFVFAYEDNRSDPFEIVLMDIVLDKGLGIDLATEYDKISKKTKMIFITGYIDYAPDIFRAKPFDLLRKPITEATLKCSIERALEALKQDEKEYLQLQSRDSWYNISANDILYVESHARKINVITTQEKLSVYMKLDEFEDKVRSNRFVRCHQSFLVNMKHISKMEGNKIILFDKTEIPVSRNRNDKCKQALFKYIEDYVL